MRRIIVALLFIFSLIITATPLDELPVKDAESNLSSQNNHSIANKISINWQWNNETNILHLNSHSIDKLAEVSIIDGTANNLIFEYQFIEQVNTEYWNISISSGSCHCLVSVSSRAMMVNQVVILLGNETPIPIISFNQTPSREPHSGNITYSGQSYNIDVNNSPSKIIVFCNISAGLNDCSDTIENVWSNPSGLSSTFNVNWQWGQDSTFEISLNLQEVIEIEDGTYYVGWSLRDANLHTSWSVLPITLAIDRSPPEIIFSGPMDMDESLQAITIDASQSIDQSDLYYSWIIYSPDGTTRGPLEEEKQYLNDLVASLLIVPSISGDWMIRVTITDDAGNQNMSNFTFQVRNIKPSAELSLNSYQIQNGSNHQLIIGEDWLFSGVSSSDTENDNDGLSYTWKLDGELLSTEESFNLEVDDVTGTHILKMIVTDDDGATDEISITIQIAGSDTDETQGIISLVGGIIVLVALTAIGVFVSLKKNSSRRKMPEWNPGPRK